MLMQHPRLEEWPRLLRVPDIRRLVGRIMKTMGHNDCTCIRNISFAQKYAPYMKSTQPDQWMLPTSHLRLPKLDTIFRWSENNWGS